MKRIAIIGVLLIIGVSTAFCQTHYSNGWEKGYKDGYCSEAPYPGVNPPIPPLAPTTRTGETPQDYNAGYTRGFIAGLDAYRSSVSSGQNTQGGGYTPSNINYGQYIDQTETIDFLAKAATIKQQQYNTNTRKIQTRIDQVYKFGLHLLGSTDDDAYANILLNFEKFLADLSKRRDLDYGTAYVYNQVISVLNKYENQLRAVRPKTQPKTNSHNNPSANKPIVLPSTPRPTPKPYSGYYIRTAFVNGSYNLWDKPSSYARSIYTCTPPSKVYVLENPQKGYVKIYVDGHTGYLIQGTLIDGKGKSIY